MKYLIVLLITISCWFNAIVIPLNAATVDSGENVGEYTSLAIDAFGNPTISYYERTNGDLKVVSCNNPSCSGTNTINTLNSDVDVGFYLTHFLP